LSLQLNLKRFKKNKTRFVGSAPPPLLEHSSEIIAKQNCNKKYISTYKKNKILKEIDKKNKT